jgi:hypothetical protein
MKKIVIVIILFVVTTTGYGGIYTAQTHSGHAGGLYKSAATDSDFEEHPAGGLFRSGSSPDDPGTRPGNGGAIGQDAPLRSGMYFLLVCAVFYGVIKYLGSKSKKFGGFDI